MKKQVWEGRRDQIDSFICLFTHRITIHRVISLYQELCWRVMWRKQSMGVALEKRKEQRVRDKPKMLGY